MNEKRAPSFLKREDLRLLIIGGKGGSGKTTMAAATAVYLAESDDSKKILVVSTDPAHSLGDSFGFPIGNKIKAIEGLNNVWGLEIDAMELLEDFMKENEAVLKKIAERGTYFDDEDIADFFSLSLPGLDEVMAIIKVANIIRDGYYDLIILDTAPTGHTIRLLALPDLLKKWIKVLDLMQEKHRYLSRHFSGRYKKDEADRFLKTMANDLERVEFILKNEESTEFVPVTIPEPMSIDETEKLVKILKEYKISVQNIVVNRIMENNGCVFCSSRRKDQEDNMERIEKEFAEFNLIKMSLFPHEVRGLKDLREFAQILSGGISKPRVEYQTKNKEEEGAIVSAKMSDLLQKNLQFILFGGKGGVGKTSLASASALYIARHKQGKKILVFSTDPAHALSESFNFFIGDKLKRIDGVDNLYGLEIDAKKMLDDFKKEYRKEIEEAFNKFLGRGMDIKFDRQVYEQLINLSPPGLDELMALRKIMDFVADEEFDLYILDTAATGHLIRFLELPGVVRDWLRALFKLLIKYKGVVRLHKTAELLIDLSKNVRKIQETLINSQKSEFVAITIPEAMGLFELNRLFSALEKLKIPCHHIVVNMVIPDTECNFCASKRREQKKYIQQFVRTRSNDYLFTEIPLFPYEIRGIDKLTSLSEVMYGN